MPADGGTTDLHDPPVYNPLTPSVVEDPFPAYAELRARCPVHRNDADFPVPLVSVARHRDVVDVMRHPEVWSNRDGPGVGFSTATLGDMEQDDPPEHQRRRHLARDWFLPSKVNALRPSLVALASSLLDGLAGKGHADLYAEYALPMPVTSFTGVLGVELEDPERFVEWADAITLGMGYPRQADAARRELSAFTAAEVVRRRDATAAGAEAPEGLLTHLSTAAWSDDGAPMPVEEVVAMVNQLLIAGHETTTSLITNCVWRLLLEPDRLWRAVVEDPELIPAAVEESLRYDPPVLGLCRTNPAPAEVGGVEIPATSKLMALYASANRDADVFPDPDTYRLDRPSVEAGRHLAFGWGIHHCLGSRLARLTGRVALEALVERVPDLRLDGPTQRVPSPFLWGRKSLPVAWG